ncbi:hypothetical protein ACFL4Z_02830 [candidate division KSB1 bacterium]
MRSDNLFKVFIILIFILLVANSYTVLFHIPQIKAQQHYQKMSEVKIKANMLNDVKAVIPENYGKLRGVENIGRSTMLWFESEDGTIRRVNLSFWEDGIILDDLVVVIERK